MGGDITQQMIRRRSEHNECVLYTMEELVLQEESIERINKTLGILCPHLKILYMPNNLIPRLENLHKLKELEQLHVAMNNIIKVQGLEKCEQLRKLDLTLNFIDLQNLPSVTSLNANVHLRDLCLTGNPCTDWDGCRSYVIAKLPHLKRLDAQEIRPRERIIALQDIHHLEAELQAMTSADEPIVLEEPQVREKDENGELRRSYTPDTRIAEHRELMEMREQETRKSERPDSQRKESTRRNGFDPLPANGRIYMKNEGRWKFKLDESDCGTKITLDVAISRFLDTSLIEIDVQPLLIRVLIKGKLLQLHLPSEVKTDASSAERSLTSGHLVVKMPLVTRKMPFKPKQFPDYYVTAQSKVKPPPPPPQTTHVVDFHNITSKADSPPKEPPKQYPKNNCIVPEKCKPEGQQQPPCFAEDVPLLE